MRLARVCCRRGQVDLLRRAEEEAVAEYMAAQPGVSAVLATSALTGRGVEAVRAWAVGQLPAGPTLYPKVPPLLPVCYTVCLGHLQVLEMAVLLQPQACCGNEPSDH